MMRVVFASAGVVACAGIAAGQSAPTQQVPSDVTVTNAIPRAPLSSSCSLERVGDGALNALRGPDDMKRVTGCEVKKVSSFSMLGQVTEVYEVRDGSRRLQLTIQNDKVLSHTLRKL